jgi:hypothetical protein
MMVCPKSTHTFQNVVAGQQNCAAVTDLVPDLGVSLVNFLKTRCQRVKMDVAGSYETLHDLPLNMAVQSQKH